MTLGRIVQLAAIGALCMGLVACGGKNKAGKPGAATPGLPPANPIAVTKMVQGVQAAKEPKGVTRGIDLLKEAIQIDPNLWEARYDLGVLYAQTGALAAAEVQLKAAQKIAPSEQDVAVALAEVRRRRGESIFDVERGTDVVARTGDHQRGAHGAGDAAAAADHLAQFLFWHAQADENAASALTGLDFHSLGIVDKIGGQIDDECPQVLGAVAGGGKRSGSRVIEIRFTVVFVVLRVFVRAGHHAGRTRCLVIHASHSLSWLVPGDIADATRGDLPRPPLALLIRVARRGEPAGLLRRVGRVDAGLLEQRLHRLRRLRANAQPMPGAIHVDLDRGGIGDGIVKANGFDECPIPRRAAVRGDDAIARPFLGAHSPQPKFDHAVLLPYVIFVRHAVKNRRWHTLHFASP